jgi:uncharacterized protein (DUF1330 family)
MKAYLIIDAQILDPVKFGAYGTVTSALVTKFGGQYLALGGGKMECLEGAPFSGKAVISEWPNREAALKFWHSPEYTEARKLRADICIASVTLIDGIATSTL